MGFWSTLKGIAGKALPIAGGLIGGPIGGAIGGALGGALSGGGSGAAQGIASGAVGGLTLQQIKKAMDEANKDRTRARGLADRSEGLVNEAMDHSRQQWGMGAPMRDAFRTGALNFGDPTNPFTRTTDMFSPFRALLQQEASAATSGGSGGSGGPSTTPTRRAQPRRTSGGGGGGDSRPRLDPDRETRGQDMFVNFR